VEPYTRMRLWEELLACRGGASGRGGQSGWPQGSGRGWAGPGGAGPGWQDVAGRGRAWQGVVRVAGRGFWTQGGACSRVGTAPACQRPPSAR